MTAPEGLAMLPDHLAQRDALSAWLEDIAAFQDLRARHKALQGFIRENCN